MNDIYKFDGLLTAINDARQDNNHLTILPNPTTGTALVRLPGNIGTGNGKISVFNMSAQMVFSKPTEAGSEWSNLDAATLCNGIYVVVYTNGIGELQHQRWVVKH